MTRSDDDARRRPEPLDLEETEDRGPRPAPTPGATDLATLLRTGEQWGWVDDDGAIHVRAGRYTPDRVVAQVPASARAQTLANLLLRFAELQERWETLRRELRRSKNPARSLKSLQSFVHWVEGAEAIGDYDELLGQVHAEIARVESRLDRGRSAKLALVERAEALAESTRWKATGELLNELMVEWKRSGPTARDEDQALWERFSQARRTFFARRDEHFAELKKDRARAREVKEALIAQAEALAPTTDYEQGFAEMQALLEEWKRAGSAGPDVDDRLWERFHAARDPFFARRREHLAEQRRRPPERPREAAAGPRERGERRDRGGRDRDRGGLRDRRPGGGPGRPRGGAPAVLTSSLADLVGPLRDLFPAERRGDGDDTEPGTTSRDADE